MLLPLIGEGRDGEYPVRDLFCCHSVLDTESPSSSEGVKTILTLCNLSNYATLNQVQSDKYFNPSL